VASSPQRRGRAGRLIGGLSGALARSQVQALAFALAAAWLGARALARIAAAWPFTTDDAYITLRYARHLLAGEGLVWNLAGPPLEGYSNFAYLLLAAGFGLLGELEVGPLKLFGVAGLLATGYLQWAIARRWLAPLPALLPFALLILVGGSFWWAVSGLETGVYMALCCAVVLASLRGLGFERVAFAEAGDAEGAEPGGDVAGSRLARADAARGPLAPSWLGVAGGLGLLASLVRPEGPLLIGAVVLTLAVQRGLDGPGSAPDYRAGLRALLLGFAPGFALYLGWRWASFAELVPNTVRCKTGYADRYALLREYWAAAPMTLVVAAMQPLRSLDARVVLPASILGVYALALIGADPVAGHHARHFLGAHALACVLASVAAVRIAGLILAPLPARVVELILVGVVLVSAGPLGGLVEPESLRERALGYQTRAEARAALGRFLAAELEPGEQAVLGDVGLAGWVGDAAILDSFCINEPALARAPLRGDPAAGAAWILDQDPALIVVHSRSKTAIDPRGAIYRELVADPRFAAGWHELRRFNGKSGQFHYVVYARSVTGAPEGPWSRIEARSPCRGCELAR
jgi:hypothetical protein